MKLLILQTIRKLVNGLVNSECNTKLPGDIRARNIGIKLQNILREEHIEEN